MPHIKLIYFNVGGRAESIRLVLHAGGVPFEDVRISQADFITAKNENRFPFGSVPVIEVDGVTFAQSAGILRYVGRLGGLYPDDPIGGLMVDQVVGGVEDMIVATMSYLFAMNGEKASLREKLDRDTYPKFFSAFERLLKDHGGDGYFYRHQLSVADLAVFPVLEWITTSIVTRETLRPYPLLAASVNKIRNHPKVQEYYQLEQANASKATTQR